MPRGVFVGESQAELDAYRASAKLRILNGDRTSIMGGGKSGSKAWPMTPLEELEEVRFAEQQNGTRAPRVSRVYQTTSNQYRPYP